MARSPYPGLRPFERDEADLFFGREKHVDAMVNRLGWHRFLAVTGSSGSGKSSLVRAGLLEALETGLLTEAGPLWRFAVMRPREQPMSELASALLAARGGACEPEEIALRRAALERGPLSLVEELRERPLPDHANLLILVDQFEELFRYEQLAGREGAEAFVTLLLTSAAQREVPIYVVLTMRSDFLGRCAEFTGLAETVTDAQYLCPRLLRPQIAAAIEGPARVFRGRVEPELVAQLVNDMGTDPDQLPLMQHALMRLWDRATAGSSEPPVLHLADYLSADGLKGSLSRHADEILAEVTQGTDNREETVRRMFCLLVEGEGDGAVRRPAPAGEIVAVTGEPLDRVAAIADPFRAAGRSFLSPGPERPLEPGTLLDISHESLIRQWQVLRTWTRAEAGSAEQYRETERRAQRWAAGDAPLWDAADLDIALAWRERERPTAAWAARYGGDFELAMRFLDASAARRDVLVRRLARRRSALVAGMAALVAVFAYLAWFSFDRAREANQLRIGAQLAAKEANQLRIAAQQEVVEARMSQSRFLTIKAQDALTAKDPVLAGLIARAALPGDMTHPDRMVWPPAVGVLTQARDADQQKALLEGHLNWVVSAAWSPDGTRIVTASWDNTARVWDAKTGAQLLLLRGHTDKVVSAAWSPDGTQIVTASDDGTARVWDAKTGAQLISFQGHTGPVWSAAWSPDGMRIVTASEDNTARIWDAKTGTQLVLLEGHTDKVVDAEWSPDGTRIVTTSEDETARVWDAKSGTQITLLKGHTNTVWSAVWSPDGKRIVTASEDETARVWDAKTGAQLTLLRGHTGRIWSVAWNADGTRIVTASVDSSARIWDAKSGAQLTLLKGHGGAVTRAAWSPDGGRIVTASADTTAREWDAGNGAQLAVLKGHTRQVWSVAWNPDGTRIVTASADATARTWDADTGSDSTLLLGHADTVLSAAWSPDGTRVVTGSWDHSARVWDAKTGTQIALLKGHTSTVRSAAWSPDGTRIVTASEDNTARVWDAKTGEQIALLQGHADTVWSAVWSPDGTQIVTASLDKTARIWDAKTGAQLVLLKGHTYVVWSAAWSPDGTRVVTASDDNTARVWDAKTGTQLALLEGHTDTARNAAWSPDGTRIATASNDGTARVWDAKTGAQLALLKGHTGTVRSAAWSPDGLRIVTASEDNTARVWDAKTGAQLAILQGHVNWVVSAAWSPEGLRILTASQDFTARVWDAKTGAQLDLLQERSTAVNSGAWSPDGARVVTASGSAARIWPVWPLLTDDTIAYADISAMRDLSDDERTQLFLEAAPKAPTEAPAKSGASAAPAHPEEDVGHMTVEQLVIAAAAGNPFANRRLAEIYERGEGVAANLERALFHHAIEARLFAETDDRDDLKIAAARRGSDARALTPEAAVRIAHEAEAWKPSH